jgi:signal peptidase II
MSEDGSALYPNRDAELIYWEFGVMKDHLIHVPARYLLVSLAVMAADQLAKMFVRRHMALHEEREVVPGLLSLIHGRNPGVAFGVLSGAPLPYQDLLLAALGLAVLALLLRGWRSIAGSSTLAQWALALIVGGALGNLVDRVRLGYVTDFVHLYWRQHDWPDFNVGDSAITVGIALIALDSLRPRRAAQQARAAPGGLP